MENIQFVSLISALSSIILSIVAIVLSILFYRWSESSNKAIQKSSSDIESNTNKMGILFDKFYSDTFGIMKSNIEAMQKQLYQSADSSLSIDENIEETILSIVIRSKIISKETICYIYKTNVDKKVDESKIHEAIDRLYKKGSLYINQNLVSLAEVRTPEAKS